MPRTLSSKMYWSSIGKRWPADGAFAQPVVYNHIAATSTQISQSERMQGHTLAMYSSRITALRHNRLSQILRNIPLHNKTGLGCLSVRYVRAKKGSHQGDQRRNAIQRTIQTYTDDLTRELDLALQRTLASLIQECGEGVSPPLISSNPSKMSNRIVSDSADTRRSRHTRKVAFRVKFGAPAWFSSRVWDITRINAQAGWDLCFRTYNRRPYDSEVLHCCRSGNLEGLKRLIQNGEASLLDVDVHGSNLISVSIITIII
jgi:hypothetical protein